MNDVQQLLFLRRSYVIATYFNINVAFYLQTDETEVLSTWYNPLRNKRTKKKKRKKGGAE